MRVWPPVAEAVERTGPGRDRLLDALRGLSLVIVVVGHAVMAIAYWPAGQEPLVGNVLSAFPQVHGATWLLQPMALFFFAGGAVNRLSWESAGGAAYAPWLWKRVQRLYRPVWPYLAIMCAVAAVVALVAGPSSAPLLALIPQLLWFLAVYGWATLALPAMLAWHRRSPIAPVVALVVVLASVDVLRFTGAVPEAVGLVNFVTVWLLFQQLGFWYVDGRLRGALPAALAVAGLAAGLLLTTVGSYPVSMVGLPGEASNLTPPTAALAAQGVLLIGLVTLMGGPLQRLLHRSAVWRPVVAVNLVAMTIYLWHLPALVLTLSLLHRVPALDRPVRLDAAGWPEPGDPATYWALTVVMWVAFGALTTVIVALMWRWEYAVLPGWDTPPRRPARWARRTAGIVAGVAAAALGAATLTLAAAGFAGFPWRVVEWGGIPLNAAAALAAMIVAAWLVRAAGTARAGAPRRSAPDRRPPLPD